MSFVFRWVRLGVAATLLVAGLAVMAVGAPKGAPATGPFTRFRTSVLEYAQVKAEIVRTMPPRSAAESFEEFLAANARLRLALQRARRDVRTGNIFDAAARPHFRRIIADTLDEYGIDVADLIDDMRLDREPGRRRSG